MHALNRSCCVGMATNSAPSAARRAAVRLLAEQTRVQRYSRTQAQRSMQKRRRRTQWRRRRRSEKRACSDTLEESSSSATKPTHGGSALGFTKNHHPVPSYTSSPTLPFISTLLPSKRATAALTTCGITSAPLFTTPSPAASSNLNSFTISVGPRVLALLNNLGRGGYAGVRLKEAKNPFPATHDRDWAAAEQRIASPRSPNEAGDSVPGSQGSVTRGVRNLQISDTLAIQTARSGPAPPPMPNSRRLPQTRPKQQLRGCLRCAQCDPVAFTAVSRPHAGSETRG